MHRSDPIPLLDRLIACSQLWSAATGRSLGALASVVVNHGSFFERLGGAGASTTTATLEKFARFLGDAGNWPDGDVPSDVLAFVHVTGVTAETDAVATSKNSDVAGHSVRSAG